MTASFWKFQIIYLSKNTNTTLLEFSITSKHLALKMLDYLKVHYATFLRAVNKQRDRALDTRNSSLWELT